MVTSFDAAGGLLKQDDGDSFVVRVDRLHGTEATRAVPQPGSRADFLSAMELLGAGPEVRRLLNGWPGSIAVAVLVTCSRAVWDAVFGEPARVESLFAATGRGSLHVWKHHCTDGAVTCIGHLGDTSSPESRVVVARICFG